MTTQEFREITALARKIERDKEHLIYLEEKATSVPSTSYGKERVQNTVQNRAGVYSDAAVDLAAEINLAEAELRLMQARARIHIETVEDAMQKKILEQRYLRLYTWETIADLLGYTVRRVHQIENAALKGIS